MAEKEKGTAFLAPLVVIIVLAIFGITTFFVFQKSQEFSSKQKDDEQNQQIACTQEAKICPDGSSVSRTGVNCEFAECPQTENLGIKTYTSTEFGIEFKYPEKLNSDFFHLQEPAVIKSLKIDKNIKDGCYIGGVNPAQKRQDIKINEINFCFSQSYDPGAGSGANYYFYTFLKDNSYFTIQYQINQPNSCDPYINTPNQETCQKAFQNYQILVDKPILDSISSIKFIVKISKAESCINSGGSISEITCYCKETGDFYNSCLVGGCSCTPDPTLARRVKSCDCGNNRCFDGNSCVLR